MKNEQLVTKYLKGKNIYPDNNNNQNIKVEILKTGELYIKSDSESLINLADILVTLALSKNKGSHFHIDKQTLLDNTSQISEIIIERE